MYTGLLHLHSVLRYIALILLLIVLVKSFIGWQSRQTFGRAEDKLSLFLMISVHIQLVLGILLYFYSPVVNFSAMSDPVRRYWSVEHMTLNLIAITLITLGRTRMKKVTANLPEVKHRTLFVFTLIGALVLVVSLLMMPDRSFFGGHAVSIHQGE